MPNDARDGRAICPFYRISRSDYISCECVIGDTRLMHVFRSRANAMEHLQRFCNTFEYTDCPYAKALIWGLDQAEDE